MNKYEIICVIGEGKNVKDGFVVKDNPTYAISPIFVYFNGHYRLFFYDNHKVSSFPFSAPFLCAPSLEPSKRGEFKNYHSRKYHFSTRLSYPNNTTSRRKRIFPTETATTVSIRTCNIATVLH